MKISKRKVQLVLAEQGINLKTLAEKIGMKPQNLSGILNRGTCHPVTAARIASGLGVEVTEILKEE